MCVYVCVCVLFHKTMALNLICVVLQHEGLTALGPWSLEESPEDAYEISTRRCVAMQHHLLMHVVYLAPSSQACCLFRKCASQ